MGYTKQAIKGISWTGGLTLGMQVVSLVRVGIVARLLVPSQIGVFGMVTLIMSLIDIVTETGINFFLIQEQRHVGVYANTAWVVAIVRGSIIAIVMMLLAPFVAWFFNTPSLIPLIILGSMVPFVKGFINPFIISFQKDLAFQKEFWFRLTIFTIESLCVVVFTYIHRNVESLVLGMLAGAVVEVVLSFVVIRQWPKFAFEKIHFSMIIGRGKWVTIAGIFNYLFHNADSIVVGKLLGTGALGLYDMSYKISMLPLTKIADVVSKVTFPVYVKISGDKVRLKKAFLKTIIGTSVLVIPFGLLLYLFPKEIISFALGKQWLGAVPVLQVLAIFGVIRALSWPTSTLFYGVKKQEYVSSVTFFSFIILAITIIPLVSTYGLIGAGVAAVVASIGALPLMGYYVYRVFRT